MAVRYWRHVVFGCVAAVLVATLALTSGTAPAGAATGGRIADEGDGGSFQQAIRQSDGTLAYLSSAPFGVSVVDCNDVYCRSSSVNNIDDQRMNFARGFAAVGNGAVISGDSFGGDPVLARCADTACSSVTSIVDAPAAGQLFALSDGGLLILDGQDLTRCSDASCSVVLGTGSIAPTDLVGESVVALDSTDRLVVLTSRQLIRCANTLCTAGEATTTHGITGAQTISIGDDNLPRIGLALDLDVGNDSYVPGLARCEDASCGSSTIELLASGAGGRQSPIAVAGDPDLVLLASDAPFAIVLVSSPLTCTSEWDGDRYDLTFDGSAGRSVQLRVGGRWAGDLTNDTSVSGTTTGLRSSVYVRHWFGTDYLDVFCFEGEAQPPAGLGCVVERNGDTATVTFENNGESANLRRDGRWVGTVTGRTSFVDANAGDSYVLIRRIDNVRSDFTCTEGGTGNGPTCTKGDNAEGTLIIWSDVDGSPVLRFNDRWLVTPAAGTNSFVDVPGVGRADYVLRVWDTTNNTFTDTPCNFR